MHLFQNISLTPDPIMSDIDSTNSCFDNVFNEIRPDSPESIEFDSKHNESVNNISDNEYTQSFLDYWLSELSPPTPQMPESPEDSEDLAVSMDESHSPAKSIRLQDSLQAHLMVSDLAVRTSHPETEQSPTGTAQTECIAPSSDTNEEVFFVRPPSWAAKN